MLFMKEQFTERGTKNPDFRPVGIFLKRTLEEVYKVI